MIIAPLGMHLWVIGLKAIAGGGFVLFFSLVGTAVTLKRFSGLFSAAPSVAIASWLVSSLARGPVNAREMALGMLAGSAGMVAYCLVSLFTIERWHALVGSIVAYGGWMAVAGIVLVVVIR